MAFKYWEPNEAVAEFGSTLKVWIKDYGLKGLYDAQKVKDYIEACKTWAAKSPTAIGLLASVHSDSKVINLIGMSGGYQAFGSEEGEHKLPAIFIDLDASLKISNSHKFVKEPHNLRFDLSKRLAAMSRSGQPMPAPDRRLNRVDPVDFNNKLAVFHEIGHAKQWIERPMFFDHQEKVAVKRTRDVEDELDILLRQIASTPGGSASKQRARALELGGSQRDARLKGKQFAEDIRAGAEKLWTDKTFQSPDELVDGTVGLPAKGAVETFYKNRIGAWSRAIEFDNMARHEWPICREMKLPFRTSYTDLSMTSGAAQAGLSTEIIRKAEAEQAKKSEVEKPQNQCEHCGLEVMNLALHARACTKQSKKASPPTKAVTKPVFQKPPPPPAGTNH